MRSKVSRNSPDGLHRWVRFFIAFVLVFVGLAPSSTQSAHGRTSTQPDYVVVSPARTVPELDAQPDESVAVVVDAANPAWVTRYGTEAGRQFLSPRRAPFAAMPIGPMLPLDGTWRTIPPLQGGKASIRAIIQAPDGRLFAAVAGDGLRVYAPNAQGVYGWSAVRSSPNGLASNSVTDLVIFRGDLWAATSDAGISVLDLDSGQWSRFNTNNGLPSNMVSRLTPVTPPTGFSYLWASTNAGAAPYFFNPIIRTYIWGVTNTSNGLPSNTVRDVAAQHFGDTVWTWFSTSSQLALRVGNTLDLFPQRQHG